MAVCDLPSNSLQEVCLTPGVKAGEQDLGSKGGREIYIDPLAKMYLQNMSNSDLFTVKLLSSDSVGYFESTWKPTVLKAVSIGSLLLYFLKSVLPLLVRLHVWNITYFEKRIPHLKKFLPHLSHFTSLKVNRCHRCLKHHKTCEVCTDFHQFHK